MRAKQDPDLEIPALADAVARWSGTQSPEIEPATGSTARTQPVRAVHTITAASLAGGADPIVVPARGAQAGRRGKHPSRRASETGGCRSVRAGEAGIVAERAYAILADVGIGRLAETAAARLVPARVAVAGGAGGGGDIAGQTGGSALLAGHCAHIHKSRVAVAGPRAGVEDASGGRVAGDAPRGGIVGAGEAAVVAGSAHPAQIVELHHADAARAHPGASRRGVAGEAVDGERARACQAGGIARRAKRGIVVVVCHHAGTGVGVGRSILRGIATGAKCVTSRTSEAAQVA